MPLTSALIAGYASGDYAASLADVGTPRRLQHSGGWILKRHVPGFSDWDGVGCYPIFTCTDWSALPRDLEELRDELVTLCLVADPFGSPSRDELARAFNHRVTPFKEHFVVDLAVPLADHLRPHHRRNVRKALREVHVERCGLDEASLREWQSLYEELARRHRIRGTAAFSRRAFELQFEVPGLIALRAKRGGATIGMTLWYRQGDIAYYHLAAYSQAGYAASASYALFWTALQQFAAAGVKWASLGGTAGLEGHSTDGLGRFKRGWSTGVRTAYFCAAVLQQNRYAEILAATGHPRSEYFPAYRDGERIQ